MYAHNIIIADVVIGFGAAHQISQTYETLGGRAQRRMLDGSAVLQNHWSRLRTLIQGSGRLPPGLDGVDYTIPIEIQCLAPRSIWTETTSATLPHATRTDDWRPFAHAIVAGNQVRTSVSVAGQDVTISAVSGASGYVVGYYPVLTVYAAPPKITFDGRGPVAGWSIEAEEI